jgi:hypothetical protein
LPGKNGKLSHRYFHCLTDIFTCFADSLTYLSDILPEKKRCFPIDFNIFLRHLARKTNVSQTSEHVFQTFSLKKKQDTLPEKNAYLKRPPDI